MNRQDMREMATRVRNLPLPSVLQALGAQADRDDKARWNTVQGVISVTGMKFMNWTRGSGGGGAIDLVIHLLGVDFKQAMAWLCSRFPDGTRMPPPCQSARAQLILPPADAARLGAVKHYLSAQRRIPMALIEHLVRGKDLYGDHRANAVFLLRGKAEAAVGAELRGTGPVAWRGMAPGSRKDLGYFSVRTPGRGRGVILCESAIDALSCFIIHPSKWCISTAGARPDPAWLGNLLAQGDEVSCGFDADPAGDAMALAMIRMHPAVKRLRPALHDWNDVLTSQS